MATATSSRVSRARTTVMTTATRGMVVVKRYAAHESRKIRRCPAVRLAVSRTARASGRIKRLIVSIIISTGIKRMGVPSGKR